ncbi:MAG: flagellar hook-length control protein FliK [Oscillospiraceae bacterium]|nr:flagellar hook-length control protein FliK [Oscillospiraceae bacterium]
MEQMQMTMLSMLQSMAMPQSNKAPEKVETNEGEDFRSMMEKQSKQPETKEPVKDTVETELPKEDELDESAMQELAAMQLFVAETMQIVTVENEETVMAVENVLIAEETMAVPQQIVAETAEMPVNVMESGAEQMAAEVVETVVETAVEEPHAEVETANADAVPEVKTAEQSAGSNGAAQSGADAEQNEESFAEEAEVVMGEQKVFREVETAPVKVSDVAAEAETAESVKAQIGDKLTETLANGETRVELQLTPDHLGKITIELTKSGDGALHVTLFAENSQTRLMLERDMGGLQSLLHQNVREDVQVEVSHQDEAQQHESYEGHQQRSREQEQRRERQQGEDFLNQLRLGLIPQEEAAS